jgi:hypothetical protein
MRFNTTTKLARLLFALLVASALATTGCMMDAEDDYTTAEEELNNRRSFGGYGGFAGSGSFGGLGGLGNGPYAECDEMFDACLEICDEFGDLFEGDHNYDQCVVKCEMERDNCVDDVDGTGGPVSPF